MLFIDKLYNNVLKTLAEKSETVHQVEIFLVFLKCYRQQIFCHS